MQTYGYQIEQAARASIMTDLEIPFSCLLQFIVFNHRPNLLALVGMTTIAAAGIFNLCMRKQLHNDFEANLEEPLREGSDTCAEGVDLSTCKS